MNKYLKTGILLLTLAIPVFIWLFLKNFGNNQFALPVYYENSIPEIDGCNNENTDSPYVVSFFTSEQNAPDLQSGIEPKVSVSYMLPEVCDADCQIIFEELANLQTTFSDNPDFQILVFASNERYKQQQIQDLKDRYLVNSDTWKFVLINPDFFSQLRRCGLFLTEVDYPNPLVMTDVAGRIRGYYQGSDPDEIDRLKGELKILFYTQESNIYD